MKTISLAAVLIGLALPATATARGSAVFPSGNSAVNQYLETIPTTTGGRPSSRLQSGGGGPNGSSGSSGTQSSQGTGHAVATSTAVALGHLGEDGSQLTAFTRATAPTKVRGVNVKPRRRLSSAAQPAKPPETPPETPPGVTKHSAMSEVLDAVAGSGGLGSLLPVLLALSVPAVAGMAVRRHRDRAP